TPPPRSATMAWSCRRRSLALRIGLLLLALTGPSPLPPALQEAARHSQDPLRCLHLPQQPLVLQAQLARLHLQLPLSPRRRRPPGFGPSSWILDAIARCTRLWK